jgi:hypothetical protein
MAILPSPCVNNIQAQTSTHTHIIYEEFVNTQQQDTVPTSHTPCL